MNDGATSDVIDALVQLRGRLLDAPTGLEMAGAAESRREAAQLAGQIDDHLVPRLRSIDAPLLTVVGGSTGAGKSTLVNSLVGADVSPASVLRPTTRSPVLVCNPADIRWFEDDRVLPGVPRVTGAGPAEGVAVRLVPSDAIRPGLALLDAPDIDSVVEANRELAGQLLAAGDLWLFVTTAARYADAVPWDHLRTARERSTALAMVLNRVPEEAVADVADHLASMLADAGLAEVPLFTVVEAPLESGRLPDWAAAPVRGWLDDLAADVQARARLVRSTLEGALDSLPVRVERVAAHLDDQAATGRQLSASVRQHYSAARSEIEDALSQGTLLRGEVLARWQEFVGTGELMRSLQSGIGRVRDRLVGLITGRPAVEREVQVALAESITTIVMAAADRAAERSVRSLAAAPGGGLLTDADTAGAALDRSSPDLAVDAADAVRDWEGSVLRLVAEEGASRRTTAKVLSTSVNAGAVALMVGAFAQTGGLTGAEVAVAGGAATLQQTVLAAAFGEQAVRTLATQARHDLLERVDQLLASECHRYLARIEAVMPPEDAGSALRAAAADVQRARTAR